MPMKKHNNPKPDAHRVEKRTMIKFQSDKMEKEEEVVAIIVVAAAVVVEKN